MADSGAIANISGAGSIETWTSKRLAGTSPSQPSAGFRHAASLQVHLHSFHVACREEANFGCGRSRRIGRIYRGDIGAAIEASPPAEGKHELPANGIRASRTRFDCPNTLCTAVAAEGHPTEARATARPVFETRTLLSLSKEKSERRVAHGLSTSVATSIVSQDL